MAPSSLLSTMAHQSTCSARLPYPSSFIFVSRRPSTTSEFHSSGCLSSLRLSQAPPSLRLPFGPLSLRLHHSLPDPRIRPFRWPSAPAWPSGSSVPPWLIGSSTPPQPPPSPAPPPSVCPLEWSALPLP